MIAIDLVIDEAGMTIPTHLPVDAVTCLDAFSKLLSESRIDNCRHWVRSTLYSTELQDGITWHDLLFTGGNNPVGIDNELRRLLMEQLDRCHHLDDYASDGTAQLVTAWQNEGRAVGCLVLCHNTTEAGQPLFDLESLLNFYREIPEMVNCTEEDYIDHASRSYPLLCFKSGIANEFRRFHERYPAIRPKISQALTVLNDRLSAIRNECQNDTNHIKARLSAAMGFSVSPESPNTRRNRQAMQERMATFNGKEVCCEWHVKFGPTTDRMHFHFGDHQIMEEKILICHFTDHFTT